MPCRGAQDAIEIGGSNELIRVARRPLGRRAPRRSDAATSRREICAATFVNRRQRIVIVHGC
jgi:hypothetical protein